MSAGSTPVNTTAVPALLLSADEPGPFRVLNPHAQLPTLLICDHASSRIPTSLGDLGLDPKARGGHLAVDIGAGAITERLAATLGVTAVLAQYSRLVVDCNRQITDPGAFLEFGDGVPVPGNRDLQQADKDRRADTFYWPYHTAVGQQVQRLRDAGPLPAFIAVHSFTPVMNDVARPWQMGVLWDTDTRLRDLFFDAFTAAGYVVGDNEPYSGRHPHDFTIDVHGEKRGLPHASVEIRQDLLRDTVARRQWSAMLADCLQPILKDEQLYRFFSDSEDAARGLA